MRLPKEEEPRIVEQLMVTIGIPHHILKHEQDMQQLLDAARDVDSGVLATPDDVLLRLYLRLNEPYRKKGITEREKEFIRKQYSGGIAIRRLVRITQRDRETVRRICHESEKQRPEPEKEERAQEEDDAVYAEGEVEA